MVLYWCRLSTPTNRGIYEAAAAGPTVKYSDEGCISHRLLHPQRRKETFTKHTTPKSILYRPRETVVVATYRI